MTVVSLPFTFFVASGYISLLPYPHNLLLFVAISAIYDHFVLYTLHSLLSLSI